MAKDYRQGSTQLTGPTVADGRYIYNGGVASLPQGFQPAEPRPVNRKAVRRKHSTFNIVGALFILAAACLLYTGNVIAVNQLMKDVNDLNVRYNTIASNNEVLKAEIARKSSLDRIGTMAKDELGLVNPKEPPVWFEVDQDKVDELAKENR
ncbi:MAG TPA: septum formation initiator family protein [Bacteroidota bacterium]|nr:septum formation initiator family protein [Bacteroidota bacterium]